MYNNQKNIIEKNRIEWVDTAKAIAIILVVMGHMGFPLEIRTIIYSFHMPLFFMLSGFFISVNTTFKNFVIKKAKTLLIPYLWFNLFFFLFDYLRSLLIPLETSFANSLIGTFCGLRIGYDCVGKFWFLPCLFISEILLYVLLKTSKKIAVVSRVGLLLIAGFFCNRLNIKPLPYSIDMALIALFFVGLGKLYIKRMIFKSTGPFYYLSILMLILIWLVFSYLNYNYMSKDQVDMYVSKLGSYPYFLIASVSGSLAILYISKFIPINKITSFIGKNTLTIYGFHMMVGILLSLIINFVLIKDGSFELEFIIALLKTLLNLIIMVPICIMVNRYFPWILGKY